MDIEQKLGELYQELRRRSSASIDWHIVCNPDILKAAGWHSNDLITECRIPVQTDVRIKDTAISGDTSQSDIWIVGKPRQRKKFRHYVK